MQFNFVDREFIPVVLGGDINTYSVARAFWEQYQVQTHVFGKYQTGPSFKSKLTAYHPNPKIDEDETFLATMRAFAAEHADKKILVMGCGDNYVAMAARLRDQLPENMIAPYIDFDLMDTFQRKEQFYRFCDKHGLDRPGTFVYQKGMPLDFELDFPFPVILKPSDGIDYWAHPFDTQYKVYIIDTREQMQQVIRDIYASGYSDDLIIQVMLKKQIELSASIEKLDVDGCTVFSVDNGRLVACFDRDVPVEVMTAMAKMEPDYAVMRDASFAGDDAVSNFAEIFKNNSSITEVEVI